ncbi:MAG: response regulator [bacterium]|nr:response regulator [bacterium]
MSASILLIEDDSRYAARIRKNLTLEGHEVDMAESGEDGLRMAAERAYDLILSDIKLPGIDGVEFLRRIAAERTDEDHETPVVMLTSVDSVRVAVEAMKEGASDYITKDADRDEIILRIDKVLSGAKAKAAHRNLQRHIQDVYDSNAFVAESAPMKAMLDEIDSVADSGAGILIVGETGAGKEVIARYIHRRGPRANSTFIDVNCAALPSDNMFQSEVFGHEKGAFTGASARKRGKLELADGGTLFLDEIGDMPLESQGKILRALETREFERLGGSQKIRVDINVIAATNKDLNEEVKTGRFRQDLLYRLDIIRLTIPPLRERVEDIMPLARHFFDAYARKYNRTAPEIDGGARRLLEGYAWPGNVRELKNLVERVVIRNRDCRVVDETLLTREGLRLDDNGVEADGRAGSLSLEDMERDAIVRALEESNWVQSEAARLLKISPDRMHSRVRKYNIQHPSWRTHKPKE